MTSPEQIRDVPPTEASAADVRTLRRIRGLLSEAYAQDPLMTWIFPDESSRPEAIAAWLGLFAESYLEVGVVDSTGTPDDLDAVAIWRRPGTVLPTTARPSIGGLLTALVGTEHAQRVGQGLAATRSVTPVEPHLYLHFLAVRPDRQGRGLGRHVVERGLARAADNRLPVHLETTSDAAAGFYRTLGFETTAELDLPGGGPHLWAMGRDA